ncbi:MAG: c-type cytochrome biogenesis protein CcmI [Gemmatimonadaceae bacterium]
MIALVVGTVLAVGALAVVLAPLFRDGTAERASTAPPEASAAREAVEALREVEFDRQMGKLSDADYASLKDEYTREALAAMREEDAAVARVGDEEVEAAIRRYRVAAGACETCGPRPEADARYCSWCGRFLAGRCGSCGAVVTESGARFCAACGKRLAAA